MKDLNKMTREERAQYIATLRRFVAGPRRPEDCVLAPEYYLINLSKTPEDVRARKHSNAWPYPPDRQQELEELEANRDRFTARMIGHPDTQLIYAGPQLCDLICATDHPRVIDLSVLRRIGNRTAVVTFARNLDTGNTSDAIAAIALTNTGMLSDGKAHINGCMIHSDESISTFMYSYTEIGPDLAEVIWQGGYNARNEDLSTEQSILANTFSLLSAPNVTQTDSWNHYTKATRTAARAQRRKLPPVNVVTLTPPLQRELDDHNTVPGPVRERDGWWPVKGFFRLQRVGPGRVNQRLTYVHPCRKGNLAGPNIGRPQVKQTG